MKRREVLETMGAALAVMGLGGCAAPPQASEAAAPRHGKANSSGAVRKVMNEQLGAGTIPGGVWLIAHGDEVTVDSAGVMAVGGSAPMRRDTIFRIASMTKAVTAAAVMILIEEGKLSLDQKAERLLPELGNRRVRRTLESPLDDTIPARAAITVQQLLDYTFGFGISFNAQLPIMQATEERKLVIAQPVPMTPHDPDTWMRKFGELPLMHQPGERWLYNVGSLLQGVLVARAAKQDFDTFVEERIFAPLAMHDTGFFVPPAKLERFAGCGIFTDPATRKPTRMDRDGAASAYATRPIFPSGAGGLCSTVDDYLVFARLLQREGEWRGRHLLRPESVRLMKRNHLSDAQRRASADSFFPGFFESNGWGFGFAVQVAPKPPTHPETYGWDGGFGTSWFTDPKRDLISIVMTQSSDFLFNGALEQYRHAVYAS